MNNLLARKAKLFFLVALFFQTLSLPVILAEMESSTSATTVDTITTQTEKPSSPADVQKALAEAGYYKGKTDGIIGVQTRAAIRSFQQENGLKVDGLVGPKTWEKLKTYLEEAKTTSEEKELLQPAAEETTPDESLTVKPEPEPLPADENLKQKLVS